MPATLQRDFVNQSHSWSLFNHASLSESRQRWPPRSRFPSCLTNRHEVRQPTTRNTTALILHGFDELMLDWWQLMKSAQGIQSSESEQVSRHKKRRRLPGVTLRHRPILGENTYAHEPTKSCQRFVIGVQRLGGVSDFDRRSRRLCRCARING